MDVNIIDQKLVEDTVDCLTELRGSVDILDADISCLLTELNELIEQQRSSSQRESLPEDAAPHVARTLVLAADTLELYGMYLAPRRLRRLASQLEQRHG